jgi:hypothetical protein
MDENEKAVKQRIAELEREWGGNANEVLRNVKAGKTAPWMSMSRGGMALQSIPLGFYDRQLAPGSTYGESPMDERQEMYNQAYEATGQNRPLSEAWVRRFGSPWPMVKPSLNNDPL